MSQELPPVSGPLKILSITAQKPHSTGSGVYLTELVQALSLRGCRQAVLAGIYRDDSVCFPDGVSFYPVYYQSEQLPFPICGMSDEMPYESTRYQDLTPEMTEQFLTAFKASLNRALAEFQPDVILCHHLYLLTALAREMTLPSSSADSSDIRPKVAGICHGSDLRQFKKNPLARDYIREQIRNLDTIWCLHREQKQEILRLFQCSPDKVQILGTGYNSQIFKKAAEKDEKTEDLKKNTPILSSDSGPIRLIFAGKLSEKKGVKSLLRSLRLLPPELAKRLSLTLAGGWGNEREFQEIRQLADQNHGCPCPVNFPGRLSQTELARQMNQSDLFILPSFYEGLPLVLIEALACGLRPICTDLPGIRPWMDENVPGHGIIFVKPPVMENEDEPEAGSLPAFEAELAAAVAQSALDVQSLRNAAVQSLQNISVQSPQSSPSSQPAQKNPAVPEHLAASLQNLSWDGLCGRLLEHIAEKQSESAIKNESYENEV